MLIAMSDKPVIQIDDDWKRQAQEEKRKLAEKQATDKKTTPAPARSAASEPEARAIPEASFAMLVQGIMTQALYYLGELGNEGEQPTLSLDMAKNQIDTLGVLEEKTKNNLDPAEQSLIDQVLYDLRSRFVGVATQMIR